MQLAHQGVPAREISGQMADTKEGQVAACPSWVRKLMGAYLGRAAIAIESLVGEVLEVGGEFAFGEVASDEHQGQGCDLRALERQVFALLEFGGQALDLFCGQGDADGIGRTNDLGQVFQPAFGGGEIALQEWDV